MSASSSGNATQENLVEIVALCQICRDETYDISNPYVKNMCKDQTHSGFHKDCIEAYVSSKVNQGFPGSCPAIYCPCIHDDKIRRLLIYNRWKDLVPPSVSSTYNRNAESLLGFLCGQCHTLRSVLVPFTADDYAKSLEYFQTTYRDIFEVALLVEDVNDYSSGEINAVVFYIKFTSNYFPQLSTMDDKDAWKIMKNLLALIEDPERRACLQLRHLFLRPRFYTPCCSKEHCFRCRTKDFHNGKTCEENINSLDSSIVPCPSCGVCLTKGDGCNSVTCLCGRKFSWNEERETITRITAFQQEFPRIRRMHVRKYYVALYKGMKIMQLRGERVTESM